MIAYVFAISILAFQGGRTPAVLQSESRANNNGCKQASRNCSPVRPRLVHPPADSRSGEIRLMSLVPKSAAFSMVELEKGDAPGQSQASAPAGGSLTVDTKLRTGTASSSPAGRDRRGGLWLSGNLQEGMARLAWIAGSENARLLTIDKSGQVKIDENALARKVESSRPPPQSPALALSLYILSNEGLLLIEQLTQGDHRYHLHIGDRVRTLGGEVEVKSVLNLDNNFDGRINSYRRGGAKMGTERPPEGFDALISINPEVVWYNLLYQKVISPGIVTFHELAEAYAKIEYGLEYLPNGLLPGAHSVAVQREFRLQSQRPELANAITAGDNLSINPVLEGRKHNTRLTALLEPTK